MEEKKKAEAEAAAQTSIESELLAIEGAQEDMPSQNSANKKGAKSGMKKKNTKAKMSQRKSSKKSNLPQGDSDLSAKLFTIMEKHKDVFFVIRLQTANNAKNLKPINDPDPFITNELMDGRDAFLALGMFIFSISYL